VFVFFALLLILWNGSGKLSMDYLITGNGAADASLTDTAATHS